MFIRSISRVQHRSAQPRAGAAWSITDEALSLIDDQIAQHRPERGGAMIAMRGTRAIVDFVADPRPGENVSYWHSPELTALLTRYLREHPRLRYVGTLHSHPGRYAEPSSQDHVTYAQTMADNPELRESLFPIVVGERRHALGSVLRLGQKHLLDLPHGTFAGYSAVPDEDGVEVRPATMHVVPLRRDVSAACTALPFVGRSRATAGPTTQLELSGRLLSAVQIDLAHGGSMIVAVADSYPATPPVIIGRDGLASSPEWDPAADSARQLAAAVKRRAGDAVPTVPDAGDALESRLFEHLPKGVSAHYLVVGAGSVGSNAAELLVRSGVKTITVVDFDTVAAANLSRTVYAAADVGCTKVDALAERLRSIAPDVRVRAVDSSIQDLDLGVLDGVHVAVLGADDPAAEFWLSHHLYERGIKAVSIKMFERGDAGEVILIDPVRGTACLRCLIGDASSERGAVDYGTGRLEAAPALGADIVATVARGVKVALALGQTAGPLVEWLEPMIDQGRTYFQHSSVGDWKDIRAVKRVETSLPFDSMWALTGSDPICAICGPDREPAEALFGATVTMPDGPPPSVLAAADR